MTPIHPILVALLGCGPEQTPRPEPEPVATEDTHGPPVDSTPSDTTEVPTTDSATSGTTTALATCGSLETVLQYGSFGDEVPSALAGTPDGGFAMVGEFWGAITFGAGEANETTLVAYSYSDTFVVKYAADATVDWVQHITGPGWVRGKKLAVADDGKVAILGTHKSEARLAPGTVDETILPYRGEGADPDANLVVLEADGSVGWATTMGGVGTDEAGGVAFGSDGAVYATVYYDPPGMEFGEVGFEVQLVNDGATLVEEDAVLARFEPDGTLGWYRVLAGAGSERSVGVAFTEGGNVLVGGDFTQSITFSAGTADEATSAPAFQFPTQRGNFIASYAPDGTLRWWRTPSSLDANDSPEVVSTSGTLGLLAGASGAEVVFGEGEPAEFTFPEDFYTYVSSFDEAGALAWVRLVHPSSGSFSSSLNAVSAAPDGTMAVAGAVNLGWEFTGPLGTVSGDAGLNTTDPFVATYYPDGEFQCVWVMESNTDYCIETSKATYIDGQGGVWVAGLFCDELRLAPGTPEETILDAVGGPTASDIFLAKFRYPTLPPPTGTTGSTPTSPP